MAPKDTDDSKNGKGQSLIMKAIPLILGIVFAAGGYALSVRSVVKEVPVLRSDVSNLKIQTARNKDGIVYVRERVREIREAQKTQTDILIALERALPEGRRRRRDREDGGR